jgi:hypothetical protein
MLGVQPATATATATNRELPTTRRGAGAARIIEWA